MSAFDGDSILVRCSHQIVEQLATKDSEPVVIIGIDRLSDGTYEMVLRSVVGDLKQQSEAA